MNRTLTNLFVFAAGAVIGSVATWKLVKTKYEKIADQEIESMREYYRKKSIEDKNSSINKVEESLKSVKETVEKASVDHKEYVKLSNRYTSQQLTKPETRLEEEDEEEMTEPYIITPEEFSDSDYSTETLTYYADGVIEDDYEDIWSEEEIEDTIGSDFASHFGEYEADSVYVRNDYKEIDYEILRDERKYSEK